MIASVLGVSDARAAAVAAEYPLDAYPDAATSPSARWSPTPTSPARRCRSTGGPPGACRRSRYQFDDGTAPPLFTGPPFHPIATHASEIQYLFDQPNAPHAAPLNATQEALASQMRAAWTAFAAKGSPSTSSVPWPSFNAGSKVLSLHSPQPHGRHELRRRPPLRVLGRQLTPSTTQ